MKAAGSALPDAPRAGQEQRGTLGLVSATGLVMSTIVGVGVFTIPAVLAQAGTSRGRPGRRAGIWGVPIVEHDRRGVDENETIDLIATRYLRFARTYCAGDRDAAWA